MSSPRTRFQLPGEAVSTLSKSSKSSKSSSSPSSSSTSSLPAISSNPQQQQEDQQPQFTLHRLLQQSSTPVAENIMSYILWDVRENPCGQAQHVEHLPMPLSSQTLDEFATDPPMPYLKVVCEIPEQWEVIVSTRNIHAQHLGAAGTRNTVPVYRPTTPASVISHGRSLSASPARLTRDLKPPPTPMPRTIPLPVSTPPPLHLNIVPVAPVFAAPVPVAPMPAPPQPQILPQAQPPRESGITIGDLLSAIYEYLNRPIHTAQLDSLGKRQRLRVQDASDTRHVVSPTSETSSSPWATSASPTFGTTSSPASTAPSSSSATSSATSSTSAASPGDAVPGMKKVDTLLHVTWFAGMTVGPGKDTVRLYLKRPVRN